MVTKDPAKVAAGRAGAVRRWGQPGSQPPRLVKIGDLTPPQRRLVLALIAAARQEKG
jgi:hypothetical protein